MLNLLECLFTNKYIIFTSKRRIRVKRHSFLLLLLISFVLSACSNEKENVTTKLTGKEVVKKEEKQDSILEELEKINLEVSEETCISMPPGTTDGRFLI